ncbi:MAG: hypothetical protein K6T17_06960 [Fimbriimonadales bacterium]|nr:hypothetical protein [Fimbriimonadales bacterium]
MSNPDQAPYPYDQPKAEETPQPEPQPNPKDPYQLGATTSGLPAHIAATIACIPPILPALIFFLLESKNRFVRFYSAQALGLGILWFSAYILFRFLFLLQPNSILLLLFNFAYIIGCIILMIQAFQGQWFRMPLIGDIAARLTQLDV